MLATGAFVALALSTQRRHELSGAQAKNENHRKTQQWPHISPQTSNRMMPEKHITKREQEIANTGKVLLAYFFLLV